MTGEGSAHGEAVEAERPRVLIVDDEPLIRSALSISLEAEGFATSEARDGCEALALLAEQPPSLVILDLMMPQKDGWSFLRERADLPGAPVPVIVLSARWGEAERLLARQLGAAEFLVKPFDMEHLVSVVRSRMRAPTP
jgi:DNA-binding response OmpR family regulator